MRYTLKVQIQELLEIVKAQTEAGTDPQKIYAWLFNSLAAKADVHDRIVQLKDGTYQLNEQTEIDLPSIPPKKGKP